MNMDRFTNSVRVMYPRSPYGGIPSAHDNRSRNPSKIQSNFRAQQSLENLNSKACQFMRDYYAKHPVAGLTPYPIGKGNHLSMLGLCKPYSVFFVEKVASPTLLNPFDMAIFRAPEIELRPNPGVNTYLKRVIALPGETFMAFMDGTMRVVNTKGKWRIADYCGKPIAQEFLQRLDEHEFAAVGDNPHASWDTRTTTWVFPWEDFLGRVKEIHYWSESEFYWRKALPENGSWLRHCMPSPRPKSILQGPFHQAPHCPYRREQFT